MQAALDKVVLALGDFYALKPISEKGLMKAGTLTHRLAVAIERQFPEWNVLYDRMRQRVEARTGGCRKFSANSGPTMNPWQTDLPGCRRGRASLENLIAIEVRKASNYQPLEHDRHKLRGLTDPHLWFAYRIGAFLNLGRKGVMACEVYVGGEPDPALSEWFASRLKQKGRIGQRRRRLMAKRGIRWFLPCGERIFAETIAGVAA